MKINKFLIIASAFVCVSGCGGGGGGGGSSSTGIRVVNGAIDAYPIDIVTPKSIATSKFSFASSRISPPGKDENALITRTGTVDQPLFTVNNDGLKRKTVLIYGNRLTLGLRMAEINDDYGKIPSNQSAIRVIHSLAGAAAITTTLGSVDVGKVNFGAASDYQFVDAGSYPIKVKRVADAATVYSGTQTFVAGKAYSVLVTGETGYLVLASQLAD